MQDAVTDGLKGAVINFGGDMARQVNTVTPRKPSIENSRASSGHQATTSIAPSNARQTSLLHATSPPQATVKPNSFSRSLGKCIINLFL